MENKLNLVLGLWNGPAMMGAYYKRALQKIANVYTVGPSFGAESDFDCHPSDAIIPLMNKMDKPIDYYIQFYSKPDFFPPDLFKLECPKAWYVYDLHLHFDELATTAQLFDMVFTYDEASKKKLLERGLQKVEVLPFAAEKEMYYREQDGAKKRKYDIGFAGSVTGHPSLVERANLLERLGKKFNLRVENRTLVGAEVSDFYQDCTVVLNQAVKNDLNMRIPETLMSGRPLLTPNVDGLNEYLEIDVHALIYNTDNIEEKLIYLLENPVEREAMAKKGQALALEKYSYSACASLMLEHLRCDIKDAETSGRIKKDPWLCASSQFRYHWFRFKGDALQWLKNNLDKESNGLVAKLMSLSLSIVITILKIKESFGKAQYFQKKE